MKRALPLFLCGLSGLIVLLEFFFSQPALERAEETLIAWTLIVSAASFIMGGVNVWWVNLEKIRRRDPDRPYQLLLVGSLSFMALLGILGGVEEGSLFNWIFSNLQIPMQSTMFSLLAFFISSAAYRAFRMRSPQATVLLLSAVVVMLGNVPLGGVLWKGFPKLSEWILAHPSLAAQRGLLVGAALGAVATSLRILLGLERGYLGIRE